METPKIYVVNLNSYNNGRTRGMTLSQVFRVTNVEF